MAIIIQQDATEYTLFKSVNFNMFWVIFDASSGAHNTVSRVPGINETCTAICHKRGWIGHSQQVAVQVSLMQDTVDVVL